MRYGSAVPFHGRQCTMSSHSSCRTALRERLAAPTLPPVTIRELRLALQDEWAAMPQQLIDTLILSMGRRCETCLAVGEIISPTKDRMFLAGHPSQGCFGLQSHCAPCYFFNQASFYPSDFSFIMSRRKQRSAFDQISEFDRGMIVAYREIVDYLSEKSVVVLDETKQLQIVRIGLTDRSVASRTVAQHIESVTQHSVSARTIRRRLQQRCLSARRPLLGLTLTQNHRRLRHEERRMWVAELNEVVFTDESRICLQHPDGRIRVWRHRGERMLNSCVMHRYTGPAPGIMGLATAMFQQDNARPHVERIVQRFFVNHQIELLPGRLALRIFHR
ncbi:transposable element Tcb1 transposase [Trichonephila clavipes]|nr:transposable element Tcb1 transposase [Trichonephila clavipes]